MHRFLVPFQSPLHHRLSVSSLWPPPVSSLSRTRHSVATFASKTAPSSRSICTVSVLQKYLYIVRVHNLSSQHEGCLTTTASTLYERCMLAIISLNLAAFCTSYWSRLSSVQP